MYDRWEKTLPSGFVAQSKLMEIVGGVHGFQKASWYDAIAKKTGFFIESLSRLEDGRIALCCDCDIFFVKHKEDALRNYIESSITSDGLDMLFMREAQTTLVNCGFMAVKNSAKVREAFARARDHCKRKTPFADQDYYNSDEFKIHSGIAWGYIDTAKVAWGTQVYDASQTLFHHAVCALNMKSKIEQQESIAKLLNVNL